MDASNSITLLWSRSSKPLGKVRRRVQDLRIPSFSYCDFISSRPRLDLSHNESTRLAVDCLLSQGLKAYHEMLKAEGEVDFLSNTEKNYILEYGREVNTDNTDAPDDEDKEFESLSAGCGSSSQCSAASTDTVKQLDQSGQRDIKLIDPVMEDPNVEVFFYSDSRAAGMKDLVRQFIRKAKMVCYQAVAIVMDSFSDAEMLCDLLEASRKRNVSVHLLLDHLNLNLFVSMWQDLKIDSKNFPKLSVRSVHGQTYCAKTGRKLTGQIAESFIITDWTEVLTGSYSFTWLSWQVHRSIAVLMKGSSVTPFLQEFHRLHSSSKPVASFVSFITLPQSLCLHSTSHTTQDTNCAVSMKKSNQANMESLWSWNQEAENAETNTKMRVFCDPQSPEMEGREGGNQSEQKAGIGSHTERKPTPLFQKSLVQQGAECEVQNVSVETPQHTVGAVSTQLASESNLQSLKKNQDQIQSLSSPRGQTFFSNVQSLLANTTITPTLEKSLRDQKPNLMHAASPTHGHHSALNYYSALMKNSNLDHPDVCSERLASQQMQSTVTKPLGLVSGQDTQREKWSYLLKFQPKSELPSDNPNVLFSMSQQTRVINSPQVPFISSRGHTSGLQAKFSFLEPGRQDQTLKQSHPLLHSHLNTAFSNSESSHAGMGAHLSPPLQPDSKMFLPGARAKMHLQPTTYQQVNCPPRLNRISQHQQAAGPRAVARFNSFSGTTEKRQQGWGTPQSSMNTSLGRSKSITERHTASFRGGDLQQNTTHI